MCVSLEQNQEHKHCATLPTAKIDYVIEGTRFMHTGAL